jgi:hypothetical protein
MSIPSQKAVLRFEGRSLTYPKTELRQMYISRSIVQNEA